MPRSETTAFDAAQYDIYSPGVERHFWTYARSRIVARRLGLQFSKTAGEDAHVLDVGCGVGVTVDYLRRAGIDCLGVELGLPRLRPGLARYVKIGIDARELPPAIRDRTGTILLLDVIEHLPDPVVFIEGLRAKFPRLEWIILTVPARKELWSNYDDYFGHVRRYDKKELARLAESAGLDILTLKYFFVGLYPVMWFLTRIVGQRSAAMRPPEAATAWFHRLLGWAFIIEERIPLFGLFPGTSLLAVLSARRS